jgi:hypothetical protein
MRVLTTVRLFGALAVALFTLHCASGSNDNNSNSCQSGYINSQYGCQPQCGGTNAVWYGGTCVPVTNSNGGYYYGNGGYYYGNGGYYYGNGGYYGYPYYRYYR